MDRATTFKILLQKQLEKKQKLIVFWVNKSRLWELLLQPIVYKKYFTKISEETTDFLLFQIFIMIKAGNKKIKNDRRLKYDGKVNSSQRGHTRVDGRDDAAIGMIPKRMYVPETISLHIKQYWKYICLNKSVC